MRAVAVAVRHCVARNEAAVAVAPVALAVDINEARAGRSENAVVRLRDGSGELTELADLNRGTFYLHYKDVFDLLEKTESELLDDFNQLVMKHDAEDLKKHPYGIFVEIYTLAYDNADLVEILLGENGDLNFLNRLKQLIRDKCLHDWMEVFRAGNPAIFDAYFSFIVSGCVGLVQYWLKTGMKETPQQLARLTEQVIRKGIGVLDTDPFADIENVRS